jgi:hypothetical protein
VEVNLDPPPIFYSDKEAILVMFMGEPQFQAIDNTSLLFAVNTNWDVFLDSGSGAYYVLNDDGWLKASDPIKGPWAAAGQLPSDFSKLPDDENWSEVRKHLNAAAVEEVPIVFTAAEPAELILSKGKPAFSPIGGTELFYLSNSESDVFLHTEEANHYFLTAGRWFRSKKLEGPWTAATRDLPQDFAMIPSDHAMGHVLASVPNTPEAQDAVLLASVPRKVTVNKNEINLTVIYEGDPQFVDIEETSIQYAVNSPYDVFKVKNMYYSCHQAVWFESKSPTGPWTVCTKVPKVIYTIPTTSPKHNVTYVYVYDSTPDTVVVGHTSGYTGQYLSAGVLLFGLGYLIHEADDHWGHYHHYHYGSHYYGYGCGARYDYHHGGYYRGGYAYGPYGGAGRWGGYNPHTGTYSRGASRYGPRGSAFAREAYNPYTDRYAARAGASNVYGSWGRSVVATDDGWARAGHRSNSRGRIAGVETSEGAAAVRGSTRYGSATIARDKHGDVYVGKDGRVYKPDNNGNWQKRQNGNWNDTSWNKNDAQNRVQQNRSTGNTQSVNRQQVQQRVQQRSTPTNRQQVQQRTQQRTPQRSTSTNRTRSSSGGGRSGVLSGLSRDSSARTRGSSRATTFSTGGRSLGGGAARGGGRAGGGGGRRR